MGVNDVPLRFFHFSGYDFRRPELISKFQNRFTFADRPDVAPLFQLYGERIRAEGQETVQDYPYQYGRFDNGVRVPEVARRTLRQVDPEGKGWPDPFATGEGSFFDWLRQPAGDLPSALPIPRLALILWDHRQDLQSFFPRPWREDRARFADWFAGSAGAPENIDPAFTVALARAPRPVEELPAARRTAAERRLADLSSLFSASSYEATGRLDSAEIAWLTADAGHDPQRRAAGAAAGARDAPPPARPPALLSRSARGGPRGDRPLVRDLRAARVPAAAGGRPPRAPHPPLAPARLGAPLVAKPAPQAGGARRGDDPAAAPRRPPGDQRDRLGDGAHRRRRGPKPAPETVLPPRHSGPEGISVIGWATAPTGVGEACRGTLSALHHAEIPCALWTLDGRADGAPGAACEEDRQGLPYEPLLFHVNADMMETVQSRIPGSLHLGRHRIGYWFWELSHFPLGLAGAFDCVDEVWAPTRFCLESFRAVSPVEVRWVPPCVVPTEAVPADRADLGVKPGEFLFFFAFDALSVPERKNPAGLLAAFARVARGTHAGGRPVRLLLKVNHAEAEPDYVEALRARPRGCRSPCSPAPSTATP